MKKRLALAAISGLTILFFSVAAPAFAAGDVTVSVAPVAPQYAAGADAAFIVQIKGQDPGSASLDYAVEGGTLSGVVAPNESGPDAAQAAAYVRRATPGQATLIVLTGGMEVARSSVEFVPGAPLTVAVRLEAEPSAAARTWSFDVVDSNGVTVAAAQVGTSGDQPIASAMTQPVPFGQYTVTPSSSRDAAADCSGAAFYSVSPAAGIEVAVAPAGQASVQFTVRSCAALTGEPAATADDTIDVVGGVRSAPLPPAAGNGQVEKPKLPDYQARQLVALLIALGLAFPLGTAVVRLLAHVAPVKKQKK